MTNQFFFEPVFNTDICLNQQISHFLPMVAILPQWHIPLLSLKLIILWYDSFCLMLQAGHFVKPLRLFSLPQSLQSFSLLRNSLIFLLLSFCFWRCISQKTVLFADCRPQKTHNPSCFLFWYKFKFFMNMPINVNNQKYSTLNNIVCQEEQPFIPRINSGAFRLVTPVAGIMDETIKKNK